jgi:hypothetical protein
MRPFKVQLAVTTYRRQRLATASRAASKDARGDLCSNFATPLPRPTFPGVAIRPVLTRRWQTNLQPLAPGTRRKTAGLCNDIARFVLEPTSRFELARER